MKIENNNFNQPSFQAKFLKSPSLTAIQKYALEKGKFEKLVDARNNIDTAYRHTYLKVDLYEKDGKPCISFSRYLPKKKVKSIKSMDDLILTNVQEYQSKKACNPLKFGLHKLIRLGYDVPNYKLFKEVVTKRHRRIN